MFHKVAPGIRSMIYYISCFGYKLLTLKNYTKFLLYIVLHESSQNEGINLCHPFDWINHNL